jgi:FkbM family methyltransferase
MMKRFARALRSAARYVENPQLVGLRRRGVMPALFERLDCPWFHDLGIATVLDIGAYNGRFAETLLALLPQARVYSFEPLEDLFKELERRATRVSRLIPFNHGLGDAAVDKTLHRHGFAASSSLFTMTDLHKTAFPGTGDSEPVTIRLERLDAIATELVLTPPVLVKIDVQGFEDRVLSGGEDTIRRSSVIIIETSFAPLYDGQPLFRDIRRRLEGWGFSYGGSVGQNRSAVTGEVLQEDSLFIRDAPPNP